MSVKNFKAIIEQVDLVDYVEKFSEVNLSGSQFRGVCPICKHGNESEFVIYDHKKFHCFVCHSSGDIIDLAQAMHNVDFDSAVHILADEFNIDIQHDDGYQRRKNLSLQFKSFADKCHSRVDSVRTYLEKKRGLSSNTIDTFYLGSNDHGEVVIPFIDHNGRHIGHAIRRFEGSPKYINSKNNELFTKSEFLFNLRNARSLIDHTDQLYLVEGYFCAMTLHQYGYAAVAYNSSQLSKQQCSVLQLLHRSFPKMTVILVPDNDGVAYPLVSKSRRNILSHAPDVPFLVQRLPKGIKDINELDSAGRFNEFDSIEPIGLDEFVLSYEISKLSSTEAERKFAAKFIREVHDPISCDIISKFLAERWHVDISVVREFLKVSKNERHLAEDFKNPIQCYQETRAMLIDKRIQYGITALDEGVRGGGRRKDVTFIGASAGTGKTFLSVQMCVDMVARQFKNVVFFSMEMSAGALYERILSNLLGKSTDEVDSLIRDADPSVEPYLAKLKEHLYVIDKNGLTVKNVDDYIKEANATLFDGKLDVVFIDYIQYMRGCSEYQVLAETAKGMKPIAKDNNIHLIVISQLNRGAKPWEKPDLGALKGGGDLEASADNVFLMWRPSSNPNLDPREFEISKYDIMLCVAKARNGSSVNEIALAIDPHSSRIKVK